MKIKNTLNKDLPFPVYTTWKILFFHIWHAMNIGCKDILKYLLKIVKTYICSIPYTEVEEQNKLEDHQQIATR